jgi:uncharacterized protein
MNSFEHIHLEGNNFLLTAGRSIYWEEKKALILSDLHLGKSGHFRKSGIGIPQTLFREDLHRLFSQIRFFSPSTLLIIGDLFHSSENKEHELFRRWRKDHQGLAITLVKGNHDILDENWYRDAGIEIKEGIYEEGGFSFSHEFAEHEINGPGYCFSGHVHPGVMLNGMGRQSLRLPCYYFGKKHAILPAYGKFTGLHIIEPIPGDRVFAIVENRLMKINY